MWMRLGYFAESMGVFAGDHAHRFLDASGLQECTNLNIDP
jgi:hypothetical protein